MILFFLTSSHFILKWNRLWSKLWGWHRNFRFLHVHVNSSASGSDPLDFRPPFCHVIFTEFPSGSFWSCFQIVPPRLTIWDGRPMSKNRSEWISTLRWENKFPRILKYNFHAHCAIPECSMALSEITSCNDGRVSGLRPEIFCFFRVQKGGFLLIVFWNLKVP